MVKVVHVTSVHNPLDNRVFFKECCSLARHGYEVTLVAPTEADQRLHGVQIRAVPPPRSRWDRIARVVPAVYRRALAEDADVYHLHDPELLTIAPGLRRHRKRVIYDVHEDLPVQLHAKTWIPSCLRPGLSRFAGWAEARLEKLCDHVVSATPHIAGKFNPQRTTTVRNLPIVAEPVAGDFIAYPQRPYRLIHPSAILSASRGAKEMVETLVHVPRQFATRLTLLGEIREPLLSELQQHPGWQQVDWLGRRPAPELKEHLGQARIGLCVLHDLPNYQHALPTKIFEYMEAGLPTIASDFKPWREMFDEFGCVRFVKPRDPRAIGAAVAELFENNELAEAMGRRGQLAIRSALNWQSESRKLLAVYARLTDRLPSRPVRAA